MAKKTIVFIHGKYNPSVVTDFKLFDGRGHSLIVDHGWQEVAAYSLEWLDKYKL